MTEEQIQKYEKWLDDNSSYDVILSAEILADLKTLQQQQKQLIESLTECKEAIRTNLAYAFHKDEQVLYKAFQKSEVTLQQIQGNK